MPRTITFIAVIAAALAVAVPTAAAEGQPTGSHSWGVESGMRDAYGRGMAAIAAKVEQSAAGFDARSEGLNRLYGLGAYAAPVVADDRFRIGPKSNPVLVAPATDTGGSEWPQIAVGAALLIALGFGTYLIARSRQRPLAH